MSMNRSAAASPGTPIRSSAPSLRDIIAGFSLSTARSSTPTSKDITLHDHIASPRLNLEMVEFSTPQWITVEGREHEAVEFPTPKRMTMKGREHEVVEFRTPQWMTVKGREHEVVEFRTPQHPRAGSNMWGGDSPLLSMHVPRESLLHTNYFRCPDPAAAKTPKRYPVPPSPAGGAWEQRRRWGFARLTWRWRRREEMTTVHLGGGKVERVAKESRGYVSHSRWPQGW